MIADAQAALASGCHESLTGGTVCPTAPVTGWKGYPHTGGPEIGGGSGDPGNRQLGNPPPEIGSSTGTGTGNTGGASTSPLDSLAAQLMGGGSGGGGGLMAAPVTVPASGGGSSLLLIGIIVAVGVVGYLMLKRKKGAASK